MNCSNDLKKVLVKKLDSDGHIYFIKRVLQYVVSIQVINAAGPTTPVVTLTTKRQNH